MFRFVFATVSLFVIAACQQKAATVFVENAHMFEMPPGQTTAAVYLKIVNPTDKNVTLNHIHTAVAGTTEVHNTLYENGMMQMREVKHLIIPAQSDLAFKPGAHHLMLFDIDQAPALSATFPLTLEFNSGEKLDVAVEVRPRS